MQGFSWGELNVQLLLQLPNHVKPLPRPGEVDLVNLLAFTLTLRVESQLGTTCEGLDHALDQFLGHVHDVVHVGVGHVEFTDGELGVMCHIDLLISEDTANFEDSVKTTDDELLEVKFGRDTHEQVELEVIVVRDEGLGGGTTSNHGHHRSLNFEETLCVKVLSDVVDDLGTCDKDVSGAGVHDQVKIPLPVSGLEVDHTFSTGKEMKTGGKELNRRDGKGKLSHLGSRGNTSDTNDVTPSNPVVSVEVLFERSSVLGLSHDLNLDTVGLEVVEPQLGRGFSDSVDSTREANLSAVSGAAACVEDTLTGLSSWAVWPFSNLPSLPHSSTNLGTA